MQRPSLVSIGVAGFLFSELSLAASPARACSLGLLTPHVLDPGAQATDQTPPTLPPPALFRIDRGQDSGGGCSGSSCDDIGAIAISVAATDDATPDDEIGYRLTLAAGRLPEGFVLPSTAVRTPRGTDGQIWIYWVDGKGDQESFSFTLQIVAIDLAGNESPPQSLTIADPGTGGCRIAGRDRPSTSGLLALLALATAAAARRRARRRQALRPPSRP
jgi:hypothetical protein